MEALIGNLPETAGCIIVTHDMAEAKQWCDRILVMLHGEVIEVLEGADDQPQHPYSRVLFDPWAGPIPDFSIRSDGLSVSDGDGICHNGEGSEE